MFHQLTYHSVDLYNTKIRITVKKRFENKELILGKPHLTWATMSGQPVTRFNMLWTSVSMFREREVNLMD